MTTPGDPDDAYMGDTFEAIIAAFTEQRLRLREDLATAALRQFPAAELKWFETSVKMGQRVELRHDPYHVIQSVGPGEYPDLSFTTLVGVIETDYDDGNPATQVLWLKTLGPLG